VLKPQFRDTSLIPHLRYHLHHEFLINFWIYLITGMTIIFLGMGMNWTRTSYLFLVMIMISVGVTSAYAITISLNADPVNVQGNLNVDGGTINVFGPLITDNDKICFDEIGNQECLTWNDSSGEFQFSDDLRVIDSMTVQNGLTVSAGNLLVSEGSFTANQAAFFNNNIDLTGNSATDFDTILFDVGTNTFIRWNDFTGGFQFSDSLIGFGDAATTEEIGFGGVIEGTYLESLRWDNIDNRFEFSDDLQVQGSLDIFEGSITAVGPGDLTINGLLNLGPPDTRTIASGVVNVFDTILTVAAEGVTIADDLDTISGGTTGDYIIIKADVGDTITVTNNGNILLVGFTDIVLDFNDRAVFIFDGTNWIELLRVNHD